MALADLIRRLDRAGLELSAREVAECLWLATFLPAPTPGESSAADEPEAEAGPAAVSRGAESGPSPVRDRTREEGARASAAAATEATPPAETDSPNDEVELYPTPPKPSEPLSSPYVLKATRVRAPGGRALPDARTLARAFRPLMRPVRSRTLQHLDLEATAERIAEQRLLQQNAWSPVLRPALVRELEIALIVDRSPSMDLWEATATELQGLLAQQGAFRAIEVWRLETQSPQAVQLFAPGSARAGARPVAPSAPLKGGGTRLLVVLTDCLGAAWRAGQVEPLLAGWAARAALTLFHVCPEHLWARSGLGAVDRLVSSRGWILPNSGLQDVPRAPRFTWDEEAATEAPPGLPVPVVALEPYALANWSRMVAGMGRVWVPAVRVSPAAPTVQREALPEARSEEVTPLERLQRFQASASPLAQRLAGLLASAPLNLPVMRLVQQALLPSSRQQHLAEVLTSGLVRRLPSSGEAPAFEFLPGVRELLRRTVRKSESARVVAEVGKLISGGEGLGGDFDALAVSAHGTEAFAADPQRLPFARLQAEVLESLGALYRPAAQQLQEALEPHLPPPVQLRRELPAQPDLYFRMAWHPDGSLLAAPTRDGRILLWPLEEQAAPIELHVSNFGVNQVAWSPDGRHLAAASFDQTARIWKWPEQRLVAELKDHHSDVRTVAWSPDGRYLATGTEGSTVRLWDTESWQRVRHSFLRADEVNLLAWSADGKLAAGCENGTVNLWREPRNGEPERLTASSGWISALAWDPSGRRLLVGAGEGELRVWDLDGSAPSSRELPRHQRVVKSLAFSADGRLLGSKSSDSSVRLWRGDTLELIQAIEEPTSEFTYPSVAFHPHLPLLATTGAHDHSIRLWDLDIDRLLRRPQPVREPAPPAPRYWALLIGTDRFSGESDDLFHYSVKEATTLAELLRGRGYAVELLTNEGATREGIRQALQRLRAQVAPGDVVFLHASGFGDLVQARAALFTYDTDWQRVSETALPISELAEGWSPEALVSLTLDAGAGNFVEAAAAEFSGLFLGAALDESASLEHGLLAFFLIQALSEPVGRGGSPIPSVNQFLERVHAALEELFRPGQMGQVLLRTDPRQDRPLFPAPAEEAEPPRTVLHVHLPLSKDPLPPDWLAEQQLTLVVAPTVEDALRKLARGRYSAVVCGLSHRAPHGDYPALVQFCRQSRPAIPVLVYPAEAFRNLLPPEPAREVGFVESAEEIPAALLRALEQSAAPDRPETPRLHLRRDLSEHPGVVGRVAWSPTHRYLAEGCRDRTLHIWDPETGRLLVENTAHHGAIYSLAWSPVAPILASGGTDGHVRFWSPEGEWSYRPFAEASPRIYDLAWSPDGQWLVVVGSHQLFAVIQVQPPSDPGPDAAWEPARRVMPAGRESRSPLFAASWSPDGSLIAVGGKERNRAVQVWDWSAERLELQRELVGHRDWITHLEWGPGDSRRLASASGDHQVRVWDVAAGETLFTLGGHEQTVLAVSWSGDGRYLATRSVDGTVRLWSADGGTELAQTVAPAPENAGYWSAGLAFHPQAPVLAGPVSEGRGTRLWNLIRDAELPGQAPAPAGPEAQPSEAPRPPVTDPGQLDERETQLRERARADDLPGAWQFFQEELGGYENLGWRLADTRRLGRILLGHSHPHWQGMRIDWQALPARQRLEFFEAAANTARDLGQLDVAVGYQQQLFRLATEHSWLLQAAASQACQAEIALLRGDLQTARGLLAPDAAQSHLIERYPTFRHRAGSLRGCAEVLAGDLSAADRSLAPFDPAQLTVEQPEDAHAYRYRARALVLLGRLEEAEQLVMALDAACTHRLGTAEHGLEAHCWLLRAEIALRRDEWGDAESYLTDVEEWLQSRDYPEVEFAATRARVSLMLRRVEAGDAEPALAADLAEMLRNAPQRAKEHGFGLLEVDLLNLRSQASRVRRAARVAEGDARAALNAATACDYAWGKAEALHCLAEALFDQLAADPAGRNLLPGTARWREAQDSCRQTLALRQALHDPRLPQTEALASQLELEGVPKPASPAQWVLILGSSREPLNPLQVRIARVLGRKLAEAGYGLILDTRRGVEVEAAREFTATLTRAGLAVDPWLKQVLLAKWTAGIEGGQRIPMEAKDRRRKGVELADAVVVIGGGSGTAAGLEVAQQAGKPVLPIAATGGVAYQTFEGLRGSWTPQSGRPPALPEIQALERRLETVDDVEAVTAAVVRILNTLLSDRSEAVNQNFTA